jgi:hypothetical protein
LAVRYVMAGGSDGNGGTDPVTDAWASVQHAIDQLSDGDPHTIRVGAGVTNGNGRVELDATNDGADLTIIGYEAGAALDNKTGPSTTVQQLIFLNTGCNTGIFRFQDLELNHNYGGNSWAIRNSNAAATDVRLEFTNCALTATQHGIGHIAAGVVTYTFTGCTLEYGYSGWVSTADNGTLIWDDCTVNTNQTNNRVVRVSGGTLAGLTIRNGCTLYGGADYPMILCANDVVNLTITDSALEHYGTASICVDAQASGTTVITGNTFTDHVGMIGVALPFLRLRNGTSGLALEDNVLDCIDPTATTAQYAVQVVVAAAVSDMQINRNTITTGSGGIEVVTPTIDGCTGTMNHNTVTITSTGANSSANGLVIGDITENPANTFGAWAQNHNTVRFTGTTAGICLLLGAAVRGTAGGARIHECAYNLMLNVASYTAGVPYGVYSVGRNVHCHHNNAYSRSPCTFVGPVDNLVELNNWVAPSGNLKGIASLTQHVGGPDPTDSIFRQNIFVALHNTASNYAFHVEGAAPSDSRWTAIGMGSSGKATWSCKTLRR